MLFVRVSVIVFLLLEIIQVQAQEKRKSRTTPATTAKPKHQGKHSLVDIPDEHEPEGRSVGKNKEERVVMPIGKSVPVPTTTTTTTTKRPKKETPEKKPLDKSVTSPTTTMKPKPRSTPKPELDKDEEEPNSERKSAFASITTKPKPISTPRPWHDLDGSQEEERNFNNVNSAGTKKQRSTPSPGRRELDESQEAGNSEAGHKGRAIAVPTSNNSANAVQDPFSLSREWELFNRRMDNLTLILLGLMKPVYSVFSPKNEELKANRTGFLDSFISNFNDKYLKRIVRLLQPVEDELNRNKAFTAINPAIDLTTIVDAIKFAKAAPTGGDNDKNTMAKGRLKWMEVNSMAATIHHIYARLLPNLEEFGLEEVNRTMGIPYPSWVTDFIIKDNEKSFQDMTAGSLAAYIHEQMNILGDENHLIRILEKLLNHTVLSGWDPGRTSLNMYCFGNNRYGQIHKKFDVLLDAALYLCLADMKFAVLEMINNVYTAWKAEQENGEKPNLEATRNEIETRLKARLERKYRIAARLGDKDIEIPIAPKRFKCDIPPKDCGEAPHATVPNCPPGVYIQDGAVYNGGTKLTLPRSVKETVEVDGKGIDCIGLELIPYNEHGIITPCNLEDGKCVDPSTGGVINELKVVLTPVLLDANRVPIYRDSRALQYPKSSEWGIIDCGIHPDLPISDPPQGECRNESNVNKLGTKCGYDDSRRPNTSLSAQFANAFPGYLESELVLSPDGKCIGTCRNYRNPTPTCTNKTPHCDLYRQSHCEDPESQCMKSSKCPNKARRCIRTSREVNVCPAKEGSGRAFDWFKYNEQIRRGGIHNTVNATWSEGSTDGCNGTKLVKLRERFEMESGLILKMPEYCEICLCVCEDPLSPEGQHYFDISARLANTGSGFVVTGLRFEQKNNTISLNIQHGQLLEDGSIDASSVNWLQPNLSPERVPLGSTGFLRLNLDEVSGRFTEVVTGIRWRQIGNALSLEAGVTEFISQPPSASSKVHFISAQTPSSPVRQRFDLGEANSPFNQAGPSQPYPITDDSKYYIEFDASSLEKDAGQSVVPFFDLQPILSSDTLPVPLSAVGILYKSKTGSGGFLAPTVRTFVHPYMRELF